MIARPLAATVRARSAAVRRASFTRIGAGGRRCAGWSRQIAERSRGAL